MKNILFSGNVKVFDGMLTCMLSIFKRTNSKEPYNFYIFTMDVSHIKRDYIPVSDKQVEFLQQIAKDYNPDNLVIKNSKDSFY